MTCDVRFLSSSPTEGAEHGGYFQNKTKQISEPPWDAAPNQPQRITVGQNVVSDHNQMEFQIADDEQSEILQNITPAYREKTGCYELNENNYLKTLMKFLSIPNRLVKTTKPKV